MTLQAKLALFIILGLVEIAVFAEEIETAPVLIPINDTSYFHCEMQTKKELKQGFVDFTTCLYCKVIEQIPVCFDKKQEGET